MSESSASSAAISTCLLSLLLVLVKVRAWRVLLSSSSPVGVSPHVDTAARTSPLPPRYRHAGWAAVLFLLGFSCQRWIAKVFTIFGDGFYFSLLRKVPTAVFTPRIKTIDIGLSGIKIGTLGCLVFSEH